jgi:hypothetical protein
MDVPKLHGFEPRTNCVAPLLSFLFQTDQAYRAMKEVLRLLASTESLPRKPKLVNRPGIAKSGDYTGLGETSSTGFPFSFVSPCISSTIIAYRRLRVSTLTPARVM